MDEVDEAAKESGVGLRHHAVAEVEDVAHASVRLRENGSGAGLGRLPAGHDARGVEVALDTSVEPDTAPRVRRATPDGRRR